MHLEEFFLYKNQLMEDILTNESIVSLIDETVSIEDAHTLAYTLVYPYEFIPETIQEGKTFVCFDVDIQGVIGKTFLMPSLHVWIFTHKSKLRLSEGGIRTDKLCSEVSKTINGSRMYGLGELNLYRVQRFAPMTDYQGRAMTFHAKDYNRQHDPLMQIPANRKRL